MQLTQSRAYDELYMTMDQAAKRVSSSDNLRPKLPQRWPATVKRLLSDCWARVPAQRPEFEEILVDFEELLEEALSTAPG